MACDEAIITAGFSPSIICYGLHSHGQYVQWKEAVVHGPNQGNQTHLVNSAGENLLTIMGFSAYFNPMTPIDINSASSQAATLDRLTTTLKQMQGYSEAYGKIHQWSVR